MRSAHGFMIHDDNKTSVPPPHTHSSAVFISLRWHFNSSSTQRESGTYQSQDIRMSRGASRHIHTHTHTHKHQNIGTQTRGHKSVCTYANAEEYACTHTNRLISHAAICQLKKPRGSYCRLQPAPQLGAKTNGIADVWVCVSASSFTNLPESTAAPASVMW